MSSPFGIGKDAWQFVNLGDGWIVGQAIYPFLRRTDNHAFFDCKMAEVIIYQAYDTGVSFYASNLLAKIARVLALVGIGLLLYAYVPPAWFWVQSRLSNSFAGYRLSPAEVQRLSVEAPVQKTVHEPPFDSRLPIINHLTIPSIGVDTDIEEATYQNYEEALKKGVWRVSDFGSPDGQTDSPVILAAHRFGYLAWSNLFRHQSSFFNLPKVKVGDTVSIVWRQRKYTYEVYATDRAEEISDYSADLILYTCETLNGPERIFVYAKRI